MTSSNPSDRHSGSAQQHESQTESPCKIGDVLARQGEDIDTRYHPSAAVRRQLNKVFPTHWSFLLGEIALYSFIVLLLTGVYLTLFFDPSMVEVTYNGVYQPLRGVEMSRAYESALNISLRSPGRPVRAPDPPLGRVDVLRGDHGAPGAHLLHRRVPATPRDQLGHRFAAADPVHVRGLLRLLAARRPAVGYRPARRTVLDHVGNAGDRHLAALGAVRRRLPRQHPDPAALRAAHPVATGDHPGADRGAPGVGVVPEAHPVPRPGPHRAQRRRRAGDAGVRGQVRRLLRRHRRRAGPDGRPAADQPDLEPGPLQAISGLGRLAAGLLHDVDRGLGPYLAAVGVLLLAPHHSRRGLGRA